MSYETITPSPYALVDLESARDYLKLNSTDRDNWVTQMVNEATGILENRTRRQLKSRTYDGTASPNRPAFMLNGDATTSIEVPEWPITAVSSLRYRDSSDVYTAMSITSIRFGGDGFIDLPNDSFPTGIKNIELKCTAGYLAGTHDSDLAQLENACKRIVSILYTDWDEKVGRGTGISVGGFSVTFVDRALPPDVQEIINAYRRLW